MEFSKSFLKSPWLRRVVVIAAGAFLGYGYYYFIGCRSGTCAITSDPWRSSAYGALIGIILTLGKKEPPLARESSERK
jgi:hypothetical protein